MAMTMKIPVWGRRGNTVIPSGYSATSAQTTLPATVGRAPQRSADVREGLREHAELVAQTTTGIVVIVAIRLHAAAGQVLDIETIE